MQFVMVMVGFLDFVFRKILIEDACLQSSSIFASVCRLIVFV